MADDRVCGRRNWLRGALALTAASAAAWPRRDSLAQMKKYSKERVGYRDEPYLGRTCAKCVLYVGHGECAIVVGQVSPEGWCTQWTPATMGSAAGPA